MFAVHLFDVNNSKHKTVEKIIVSVDVAEVLINLDSKQYPLLSSITFVDEELFNGEQLVEIRRDVINLLLKINIENQKIFLQMVLLLIDVAIEKNLWILFNPFIGMPAF